MVFKQRVRITESSKSNGRDVGRKQRRKHLCSSINKKINESKAKLVQEQGAGNPRLKCVRISTGDICPKDNIPKSI